MKVEIKGKLNNDFEQILAPEAKDFLAELHEKFNHRRIDLLAKRLERQREIDKRKKLTLLDETKEIREKNWQVVPCPEDFNRRWVEITGPPERKMLINALNSGADVYMTDFEDSNSPTWYNCIQGQVNCFDAFRKKITFFDKAKQKDYQLRTDKALAMLVVRPRGWHMEERNIVIDGQRSSASLTDFGLAFFHNAKYLFEKGSAPYFYLPKMESYHEARLWNDVFIFSQEKLGIPNGTIRATALIETIPAAFQMEEILYEIRDHAAGLNAGRWDYIFSCTKRFSKAAASLFPDRKQVTMTVPFMRAYTERLVYTCHKHGAHAIGGMSAFVPNAKFPEVTKNALEIVRDDKKREATDGFDGSWVAHPDLVEVCREEFAKILGNKDNQKDNLRLDVPEKYPPEKLIDFNIPKGKITYEGLCENIEIGLQYIASWLKGNGAVALNFKMEDVATAEISRSQIWQWINKKGKLDDGTLIDEALYKKLSQKFYEKNKKFAPEEFKHADRKSVV